MPAHHLVTHGVVVGMTGSGKTGLVTVMVEEALRSGIPVLAFDVKGDLPNQALELAAFPRAKRRFVGELLSRHEGDKSIVFTAYAENASRLFYPTGLGARPRAVGGQVLGEALGWHVPTRP